MSKKALVKNAADKQQVKNAAENEKNVAERDLEDIRRVMSTPYGRRVIWRVLTECKVFGTVLHPSGSMTYYNSGRQDLGHWLMGEIVEAGEELLFNVMKENYNKGELNV